MDETLDRLGTTIAGALGGAVLGHAVAYGELTVTARAADIVKVAAFLRDDLLGVRLQGQFAVGHRVAGHHAGQRTDDRFAESLEGLAHGLWSAPHRSIVPVRRIFFCSSRTP